MDQLSIRANAAKNDDEQFYSFAKDNLKFIKKCAVRTCHRFITESEDEWSIALIAFYEAVRTYDSSKGRFRSFAQVVIQRRLMDYFDSVSRHKELAVEPFTFDGQLKKEEASAFEIEVAGNATEKNSLKAPGTTPLEDEVGELQARIAPYGFELYDIGSCSPKAKKTKRACQIVIKELSENDELFQSMRRKLTLPHAKLLELDGVNKKLLERHRKYLIAAAEICRGDFPNLKEYICNL